MVMPADEAPRAASFARPVVGSKPPGLLGRRMDGVKAARGGAAKDSSSSSSSTRVRHMRDLGVSCDALDVAHDPDCQEIKDASAWPCGNDDAWAKEHASKLAAGVHRHIEHHDIDGATSPKARPTPSSEHWRERDASHQGSTSITASPHRSGTAAASPGTHASSASHEHSFLDRDPSDRSSAMSHSATQARSIRSPLSPESGLAGPNLTNGTEPMQAEINKLADAIVASTLATTRHPTPDPRMLRHPPPMPPPPRKRSIFSPRQHHAPRSPSPPKHGNLRETMRPVREVDAATPKRNYGTLRTTQTTTTTMQAVRRRTTRLPALPRKHPHKHAEGDRKHWRDAITPLERRRYEALYASNRGLLLDITAVAVSSVSPSSSSTPSPPMSFPSSSPSPPPPSPPLASSSPPPASSPRSARICNLVARDIYARSRLGREILAEVYALVNDGGRGGSRASRASGGEGGNEGGRSGGNGTLSRAEFIVGLWLIDQRLRGKKLPARVGRSVWRSVGLENV